MTKRAKLRQVVSAVNTLDNNSGVTPQEIFKYLQKFYGISSPPEYKGALNMAVTEGFLTVNNNRFYPSLSKQPLVETLKGPTGRREVKWSPEFLEARRRRKGSRRRRRGRRHADSDEIVSARRRRRRSSRRRRRGRRHADSDEIVSARRRRRRRSSRRRRRSRSHDDQPPTIKMQPGLEEPAINDQPSPPE